MDFNEIRASSCELAKEYGFHIPDSLSLLDSSEPRQVEEIIDRALAVSLIVAVSYGFKKDAALSWLEQESLVDTLSQKEKEFLNDSDRYKQIFQAQVETLCAFAWSLRFLPDINFSEDCPNHLVSLYPDFKKLEPSDRFRQRARLRSDKELVSACDAAYCLHWGLNQSMLDGVKPKHRLSPIVVTERRRALEWILNSEDWDSITLDT
jgi:hypothetical protein